MCNQCKTDDCRFTIDIEAEVEQLTERLGALEAMVHAMTDMVPRDYDFAQSLYDNYRERGSLSNKQWAWVETLTDRVKKAEPIYGDFTAIHVMFRMTQGKDKAHKRPKIRLMTKGGRYVQINFRPGEEGEKNMTVYVDGWQGHGYLVKATAL